MTRARAPRVRTEPAEFGSMVKSLGRILMATSRLTSVAARGRPPHATNADALVHLVCAEAPAGQRMEVLAR